LTDNSQENDALRTSKSQLVRELKEQDHAVHADIRWGHAGV
jgi:hypothetical protein